MYAVVKIGSDQFKVAQGDRISVKRLQDKEGASITLDQVLMLSDGDKVTVGTPYVSGAKISADVVAHELGAKTDAFKFRRRTNYARKRGHRALVTVLNIAKISA
jgi:large subunit ribosomal protein L21